MTIISGRAIVVMTFSGIPSGGTPSASRIIDITVRTLSIESKKYTWPESRATLSLDVAQPTYVSVHQVGHHLSLEVAGSSCSRRLTGINWSVLLNSHGVVPSRPVRVKVHTPLGVCGMCVWWEGEAKDHHYASIYTEIILLC